MRSLRLLVVLAGCGTTEDAAYTREEAVEAYAKAFCRFSVDCREDLEESYYAGCVERTVTATTAEFTCYSAPVAAECIEAWETLACDQAAYSTFPCADAFRRPPCGREPQ